MSIILTQTSNRQMGTGELHYHDRGDPSAWDRQVGDFTTDGTWRDWDLSSIVPYGAKVVHFKIQVEDGATGSRFRIRKNGNTNTLSTSMVRTIVVNIVHDGDMFTACDEGRIVEYWGENLTFTTLNVLVKGWFK